jgi:hypothetical protein
MAIPFFDACLELRLPEQGSGTQALKPIDSGNAFLSTVLGEQAVSAKSFAGKLEESNWLPNEKTARLWEEYIKTGATSDTTPPASPVAVTLGLDASRHVEVSWDAYADFESGLQGFVILRDGKEIGRVPEKGVGRFGRPLFQTMSYHDTPEKTLPQMRFVDKDSTDASGHEYSVISVNSVGLKSTPGVAARK